MLGKGNKITTLFWIAISGVVLTSIYSIILAILGIKSMTMINYIYKQNKKRDQQENLNNIRRLIN
ncbi:hypothetical protein HPT25_21275 [Bacillus sp. BRMEA1]|uniref:hypothetical protein n=1 Tax=Neobacillus endophyticus TaxID=2738405 RepID=UPI0015662E5F|nr:hypothetical protein [Neobacillus endophyticus]NRD79872.1 hypothetical protein [Neobacillus endophyticus]